MAKTCKSRAIMLWKNKTSPVADWPRLFDSPGMVSTRLNIELSESSQTKKNINYYCKKHINIFFQPANMIL